MEQEYVPVPEKCYQGVKLKLKPRGRQKQNYTAVQYYFEIQRQGSVYTCLGTLMHP